MFGLKKKKYLEYYFESKRFRGFEEEVISEFLEKSSSKSSCYWASLLPTINGQNIKGRIVKFQKKYISNPDQTDVNLPEETVATVRQCPAVNDIIQNAYLLKSPVSILITINQDGSYIYNSSDDLIQITSHSNEQFKSKSYDIFKDKINIKFSFPIRIKSESDWMFIQPMYHNDMWFDVAVGNIQGKYKNAQQLNLNTFVDIPKNGSVTYEIKPGDVLAYVWFRDEVELRKSKKRFCDQLIKSGWLVKTMFK